MDLWYAVKEYFEEDDGSLPDIFIEKLTHQEMEDIYGWVLSITEPFRNTDIYSIKEDKDVPLEYYKSPVRAFNHREVAAFRIGLKEFKIKNITIPQLTIAVRYDGLEFDYKMGKEWEAEQVEALFEFLALIKDRAPFAQIIQADEGGYNKPNIEFTHIFDKYYTNRTVKKSNILPD